MAEELGLCLAGRPHGREELRLYDLRHTAASLMIRQASVKAVQKQLGDATALVSEPFAGCRRRGSNPALPFRLPRPSACMPCDLRL